MPKRERSGDEMRPLRVVAPTRVKRGQFEPDGAGVRSLIDHDVDHEILHRGVKVFFHGALHAVDLIDEDDVTGLKAGEQSGEIAGLVDDWARCGFHMHAHRFAEDECQRGFTESRGAGEQHVVEGLFSLQGCFDREQESVADISAGRQSRRSGSVAGGCRTKHCAG